MDAPEIMKASYSKVRSNGISDPFFIRETSERYVEILQHFVATHQDFDTSHRTGVFLSYTTGKESLHWIIPNVLAQT